MKGSFSKNGDHQLKGFLYSFLLLAVFFYATPAYASDPGNSMVTVLRADNNEPLEDAIVKIAPLDSVDVDAKVKVGFTGSLGQFRYMFTGPVIVQVSHIGYGTITDTLYSLNNKVYRVKVIDKSVQDVVVTAQYTQEARQKSMYNVSVITNDEIRAKGANNLREALQNELHIDLGQDPVFGSSLGINGISGEGVKILVDGVPIVGRLDGKLDLSQINISNIERIEIIEGPLSVMYGTDAMGGVINIVTKGFQQEKINLNLKGYYESVGQYNGELNMGFAFKKNQFYLSGGRNFFGGYSAYDTLQRFKEWKPKEQYFADARYIYTDNRYRLTFAGSFFRELMLNRSVPLRALSYENGDTAWTYLGNDYHYLTYRPRASASFMYRFKQGYQLDVLLAYSGFIRYNNEYSKDLVTLKQELVHDPTVQDTAYYHQILARAIYGMPAWKNRLNFQFGIDVTQEYTKENIIAGDAWKSLGDYAAFGSVRISLVEGLDVQPAVRIVYNTRYSTPLIPSLNLRYSHKDNWVLRVSYGRGYRAPSLKELYMSFFDSNHSLKGNPGLKPEDGHCLNGSFNYIWHMDKHSINISAAGFYNNISNKIDWKLIPAIGPVNDTFQYFNIKHYITYGGDVTAGYRWDRFHISAAAQVTRYELSNSSGAADKVKSYSPDFTATVGYLIPKAEIDISVAYKYNGPKPLFTVNNSIQAGTRYAYSMLDVSLSRNFWHNRIQVTIGGKNLIGVTNVTADGLSGVGHNFSGNAVNVGWGRTFFATLVLHYGK